MIDERFTIVQEERFIEATRDSGYKSTASAISELADNAFQAGANEFIVHFRSEEKAYTGRGPRPQPVIEELICVDDGSGMTPEVLRTALRFGGTSRFDDRTGLGRFGM
ncbi:MAG: ATP-binding protein, partial [Planctomycetes bacterium]|nr:ATP-binding protein [Planctomycetota bacterium]